MGLESYPLRHPTPRFTLRSPRDAGVLRRAGHLAPRGPLQYFHSSRPQSRLAVRGFERSGIAPWCGKEPAGSSATTSPRTGSRRRTSSSGKSPKWPGTFSNRPIPNFRRRYNQATSSSRGGISAAPREGRSLPRPSWRRGSAQSWRSSSRGPFCRNGYEVGLPLLEVSGIHELVETEDRLRVDVRQGVVENLTSGKSLRAAPPPEFLLEMLEASGLIPLLKSGSRFLSLDRGGRP